MGDERRISNDAGEYRRPSGFNHTTFTMALSLILFRLEIIERAQQTIAPIIRNPFNWVQITLSVEKLDLFLSQYLGHFILPGLYLN